MAKILIKCTENSEQIHVAVLLNRKPIVNEKLKIAELVQKYLLNSHSGKTYKVQDYCEVTVFWNCRLEISSGNFQEQKIQAMFVTNPNRVTFKSFLAKSVIVNSRSLYAEGRVVINHLLFQFLLNEEQSQTIEKLRKNNKIKEQEDSTVKGKLKVSKDAKLQVKQLKILNSDLIIDEKGYLKMKSNTASQITLSQHQISIYPYGKISSSKQLFCICDSFQNWGYIGTQTSTVNILSKQIKNHGLIDSPVLNISCRTLEIFQKGKIKSQSGIVIVTKQLENKGRLITKCLSMSPSKTKKQDKQERVTLKNHKEIQCHQIQFQGSYFENRGQIVASECEFKGAQKKCLFKNSGRIMPSKKLMLQNFIVLNNPDGQIISNGNITMDIDACINEGEVVTKQNKQIKSKGTFVNKGILKFSKDLSMEAKDFLNHYKVEVGQKANIKINELFYNSGEIKMKQGSIEAVDFVTDGMLKAEKSISIETTNMFINGLLTAETFNLKTTHLDLTDGRIRVKNLHVQVPIFKNQGTEVIAENFTMKGIIFENRSVFIVGQKGQIILKSTFTDSSNAFTMLNNVKIQSGPVIGTRGKLFLKGVEFEGVRCFYNWNELYIEDADYDFLSFDFHKLHMKKTHITTGLLHSKGQVYCEGGSNALHQRQKTDHWNYQADEFVISMQLPDFAKDLKIYMNNSQHFRQAITSNLNAFYLLNTPLVTGNFIKTIYANCFELPDSNVEEYQRIQQMKPAERKRKGLKLPEVKDYQIETYGEEQMLNIEVKGQLNLRGNINFKNKYNCKHFSLKSDYLKIQGSKVTAYEGLLKLEADQGLSLIRTYIEAKGIGIKGNYVMDQVNDYRAGLMGLFIESNTFKSFPVVTKHRATGGSGDQTWERNWQTAERTYMRSQGDIVIRADQYLQMISPSIIAQKDVRLISKDILIHGMFLLDQKTTKVQKDNAYGGSKTNVYYSRNDKAFPAHIQGKNIILEGGRAQINAKLVGQKLYDLTQEGVHLFFIIGYNAQFQNRQFGNYVTQGCEGYSKTSEKLLKSDLKQLMQIYRPPELGGLMRFDSVDWGKNKAKIQGVYKQKIYKCKTWYKAWEHESLAPGPMIVISIAAAFAGANFIAPYFTTGLTALQTAMVKAGFATLTQRFVISIAQCGGDIGKAFQSFLSIDTVKALAFNIATAGLNKWICDKLEINPIDPTSKTAPPLMEVFKENLVKHAINIPLNAIINRELPKNLKDLVVPFVADVFGQYTAGQIGFRYRNDKIDYLTHKALHGIVGGLSGFIMKGNWKGAAAGAVGAIVAEVAIQAMIPKPTLNAKAMQLAEKLERGQTIGGFDIYKQVQLQLALAKIIGTVIGGALTGDWNIARYTSDNAITYNCLPLLMWVGQRALDYVIAKTLKYLTDKYIFQKIMQKINISAKDKAECDDLLNTFGEIKDFYTGFKRFEERVNQLIDKQFEFDVKNIKKDQKMIEAFDSKQDQNKISKYERWTQKIMTFKWSLPKVKYMAPIIVQKGLHKLIDGIAGKVNITDMFLNHVTKPKNLPKADKFFTDKKNILKVDKNGVPLN